MADMEPPTKKAKTEEVAETEVAEPAAPTELETDAPADKGSKITASPAFYVDDTTMNVMPSADGNTLMPLTDGGLQYLMAGARASVGLKSGRYMFEVKILEVMAPLEDPNARARVPQPKSQLRVGYASASSSLFLGESADSVCFDSEGHFIQDKKRAFVSQKFTTGDVIAIVLNLDSSSANANTVSLFKNGVRACPPQSLPENLTGEKLFPALSFKNMAVHYNFGALPMAPLPFSCRMVKDASQKDAFVKPAPQEPKDGKYDVLFPVCLPDEGTFDWLDQFLAKNPQYTELSDRALLNWCEASGINRPKGYSALARVSNDKPEMGFGITVLDDLSVRRVLQAVAPIQKRHYIVMEVKGSLVKEERTELAARWAGFKRVATVVMSQPPAAFTKHSLAIMLKSKQEVSDAEFKGKQAQEKQKRFLEKSQKKMLKDKEKAVKKQLKIQEAMKKKMEFEKAKKEAEAKGEPAPEEPTDEPDEEEEEVEEPEPIDEDPPTAELTAEEKKLLFRKNPVADLTPYLLNTSFQKFSLPEQADGFEEINYEWGNEAKSKQYLKSWMQEKKTTSRVEELVPSEWFNAKWRDWQKVLQAWHVKQNAHKAGEAKKVADAAAREAKRKAREAAKAKAEKEGTAVPMEEDDEEEPKEDEKKVDLEYLDVFGIEDVADIGGGEPLFSAFNFEDWTMMSLRFELHLLAHAFRRDVNDPDRVGIHLEHLPFYYNKYYKKSLNSKYYGVDTFEEVLEMVRDTVLLRSKVLETQLPDDLESSNVFTMLTEEARRDRNRRVDMGEDSAKLKIVTPGMAMPGMAAMLPTTAAALMAGLKPAFPQAAAGNALAQQMMNARPTMPQQQMGMQQGMQQQQQMGQQQQWFGQSPFGATMPGFRPQQQAFGARPNFQQGQWNQQGRGW
ncbi:unnamed protein product [Polarella glacialis]|uniref:B30.2/SPRY domain-containing protein n=1 Tax=Polarella glacialis TaxID=89957 RepID=A0A813E363_POLGL|nr:unnamed protein product [Polarella glacialis]